ncbi:hypothetical protein G7Y89_g1790 [Cudoniella acicularis]|uniref:Cupin type-2 domain-containing protein n=1 Tax=Cudoniella acicularis TaxID=354080 RepID=A0A8H4RWA8_9HELO|nr:hypothetical protein G7Y89_g1790 [Cudoniella acicularis]
MAPVEHRTTPPGKTGQAYVLPCYTGELWTIPTSNSTMRLLVTGKETDNAFAIVGTGGTYDKPIGFHYHKEAHDVFLCIQGKLNVWANDKARSLLPGDFASVPPGTIHQYQVDSHHTEFIGLIIPGGWEEFFRFIGEPYAGPLFPTNDKRNPFEVLIPKLMAATEKFDMIPVKEKEQFDPQPWDGSESALPGKCEIGGYYLKAGKGEKWVVGGTVVRALARREETRGKFSIYEVEASAVHAGKGLVKALRFQETHHAGFGGCWRGTKWSFGAKSAYARAYVFANGGGLGEVLTKVGVKYEEVVVPNEVGNWGESKVQTLAEELKFTVV